MIFIFIFKRIFGFQIQFLKSDFLAYKRHTFFSLIGGIERDLESGYQFIQKLIQRNRYTFLLQVLAIKVTWFFFYFGCRVSEEGSELKSLTKSSLVCFPKQGGDSKNIFFQKPKSTATECCKLFRQVRKWGVTVTDGVHRFTVCLNTRMCSCGRFQHDEIPCAHAITVIGYRKKHAEDYYSIYYSNKNFRDAYAIPIEPLPCESSWVVPEYVLN